MFVKVCGIRNLDDLSFVERYADATGVIVECESKRKVSLDEARKIVLAATIPVFVVSTLRDFEGWKDIIKRTEAEYVQIHTDSIAPKDVERIKSEFGVFIMKSFKVPRRSEKPEEDAERLVESIERFEVDRVLLDTGKGSGLTHDHRVSRIVARRFKVVLAGGLNPENVCNILKFVKPFGVDVSSGVERNGRKDPELVRKFVERVRGCS